MEMERTSPWLAVTVGILGMVAGYSIVLAQTDQLVVVDGAVRCPSHALHHNA